MCYQTQERMQAALNALAEFAASSSQLQHKELRAATTQVALDGLSLCEGHGQRCINLLFAPLQNARQAGAEAVHDALWMLYKVVRSSEAALAWVAAANGVVLVQEALILHIETKLIQDGVWLVYALEGLSGLAALLCRSSGDSECHVAVRSAVAWLIYELVRGVREECTAQPQPEPARIAEVLVQVMRYDGASAETQWFCCSALDSLLQEDKSVGTLFVASGGTQLLLRILRAASLKGAEGEGLCRDVCYLLAALAEGSSHNIEILRGAGSLTVLSEDGLAGHGRDVEAAMWALGAIGGVPAVVEAMNRWGPRKPAVVRGGVIALSECAWTAIGDVEQLKGLPMALSLLLDCLGSEMLLQESSSEAIGAKDPATATEVVHSIGDCCIKTLGSVLASLAPHAPPGQVQNVDRGVKALLDQLQHSPANASSSAATRAEGAADAIGRMAQVAPDWRVALRNCGTLEALALWISAGDDALNTAARRRAKYLVWASAAIAGLPFVANALRLHSHSLCVVDACLCTIIDILDDDIEGDYTLVGVEKCSDADVPVLFGLVVEVLQAHQEHPEVQARGSHCVALLAPRVPIAALEAAAPSTVDTVLSAGRRYPRRRDVPHSTSSALRAMLSTSISSAVGGAPSDVKALAAAMKRGGAADYAEQVLDDFGAISEAAELLENAAAVLVLLAGVEALIHKLVQTRSTPLRIAGLKALFEVGRAEPRVLAGGAAVLAGRACTEIVAEQPPDASNRLGQVAELLLGLCDSVARQA